jgi:hypothetical protein
MRQPAAPAGVRACAGAGMTTPLPPLPPGDNGSPERQPTAYELAAAAAFYTAVIQPWIASVAPATLPAHGVIDPLGVLSASAMWTRAMNDWIKAKVLPQLKKPLQNLFGPKQAEVIFEQLPFVTDYAGQLQNYLSRVPDELFRKIRAQVQAAADEGTPIPDLAGQIKGTLLDGGADYWRGRGETIARTEIRAATQGGLVNAYSEYGDRRGLDFIKQWLDSHDTRVREAHQDTDGQRRKIFEPYAVGVTGGPKFPAMWPGDMILPPNLRINCRCDQLIEEAGERMTSQLNRGFRG